MNPFIYPALIVLCLCGLSTAGALALLGDLHGFAPLLIAPVWITAGWMLAAIALASLTGTGARGAVVTTVLMIACVACVIFLAKSSEKRSQERRLKRAEERTK
jgi:hypothetical protein